MPFSKQTVSFKTRRHACPFPLYFGSSGKCLPFFVHFGASKIACFVCNLGNGGCGGWVAAPGSACNSWLRAGQRTRLTAAPGAEPKLRLKARAVPGPLKATEEAAVRRELGRQEVEACGFTAYSVLFSQPRRQQQPFVPTIARFPQFAGRGGCAGSHGGVGAGSVVRTPSPAGPSPSAGCPWLWVWRCTPS